MNVILTTLNAKYTHSSLALRYLREYCRDLPCAINIKEFTINQQLLTILGELYAAKPDIIGISCSIWNIEMSLELISLLKKVMPEVILIIGGPEVTYDAGGLMQQNPAIDYIVEGEGEESFYQLLAILLQRKQIPELTALSYRSINGEIVIGEPAVIADLDVLPFPYQAAEMAALADKIIYYESSRGCPFACQYCLSSATNGVRFRSVECVLTELKFFINHRVRQVKFVDRTFNTRKEHYLAIWRFLASAECTTNFHFEIAVDLLDEESMAVLSEMPPGRIQLEIGIQSTNPITLTKIKRVNDWQKITNNVKQLLAFKNMHLHLDLIVGLPNENYDSFGRSFNDVYALQPDMLQIGFLKMLKGAGITKIAKETGYAFMDKAPYQVLANEWLSYGEVYRLTILTEIFEEYYNSGRFRNTLTYLVKECSADAFSFFNKLKDYWCERGLHNMAHGVKGLYEQLRAFVKAVFPNSLVIAEQMLKLDILLVNGQKDIAGLPWSRAAYYERTSAFWRSERVKQYLPDFSFSNWRNLQKQYHIEVFDFSVAKWLEFAIINEQPEAVLFCYNRDKTQFKIMENADILEEGQN